MEFLKEAFGDAKIGYDDFVKVATEKGFNIADLSKGGYVGVEKHNTEVGKFKTQFETIKKQYDEQVKALDGDDGLKKQIEKLTGEKSDFEGKFNQTTSELSKLKNTQSVMKAGVVSDMADFVTYEVGKMTNDTLDFDTALKGYLSKNPQFKSENKVKVKTTPNLEGKNEDEKGLNQKMNQAFLKAAGRE